MDTPINQEIVKQEIEASGLKDLGHAKIREIVKLVNKIEARTGEKYIRMEMGVPGLAPPDIGTEAEIEALRRGVASKYASIEGIPELKDEASRFIKLFIDTDIDAECCVPTTGSLQGAMACFLVANRTDRKKEGTLFIDPGFPVHKQQCQVLGQSYYSFDVYNYRGDKLRTKLESFLVTGKISSILFSNPNNPSWVCMTDKELQIIGDLANQYDITIIEDLAYFGMDFRKDYSKPGTPPYQPSISKYTDNYVLLISSSKSFSYAGQRVGIIAMSNKVFHRRYPDLLRYYSTDGFGYSVVYGALYALSAGVAHSAQYALAAMLKAANDGKFDFINQIKVYGDRAKIMKQLFIENGFKIVYDRDENTPIADGFYFTISYPGMSGSQLLERLMYYGISAIALITTGSEHSEGLRACVSQVQPEQFPDLEHRLSKFREAYGEN